MSYCVNHSITNTYAVLCEGTKFPLCGNRVEEKLFTAAHLVSPVDYVLYSGETCFTVSECA